MAIVKREIVVNTLEPSPFSFRAPSNVSVVLEVALKKQDLSPYTIDLEMVIQLNSRTTTHAYTYAMPMTDLANGKARAVIGPLTDVNGYNIEIVGTIDGTLETIAAGVLILSGRGIEISETIDAIDNIPLNITRGQELLLDMKLWQDAGKNIEFTGAVVTANLRAYADGPVLASLTVTPQAQPNEVRLSLTSSQTTDLPSTIAVWDVVVIAVGQSQTVLRGSVRFTG